MITRNNIQNIFYDIASKSKRKDCGGINSFVYVSDGAAAFSSPTGGKSYADYLQKEFWARDWELSGANENTMKLEAGILFIESKMSNRPNLMYSTMCHEFYITFADMLECKTCDSQCVRTRSQVDNDTLSMLNAIISELLKYELYRVDGVITWTTEGYINYLNETKPEIETEYLNKSLSDYIDEQTALEFFNWGEKTNYVGYSTKLTFCGCVDGALHNEYATQDLNPIANVKCSTCE